MSADVDPMVTALTQADLVRRAGSNAARGWTLVVTPENAGWRYAGLRTVALGADAAIGFDTGADEAILLPVSGSAEITCDGQALSIQGRASPFDGPTDFAYLPPGARVSLRSPSGGKYVLATARAERRYPFRYGPAAGVTTEIRGAGSSSREVRHCAMPATFEADRLMVVEVLTPGGNWSSFPPHKHDETTATESALEEIYYYEIAQGQHGPGVGYQRAYGGRDPGLDLLVEVRSGDVVLIPNGWHGPSMAPPGYDMYYLNVMAGPGRERAWRTSDDPAHAWIRWSWEGQPQDPRLLARSEVRR